MAKVAPPRNVNDVHQERLSLDHRIGKVITDATGTMWCAAVFFVIALVSLPAALHSHDVLIIVGWLAQTCLQLVLLPIILVGQNVSSQHDALRAEADHESLTHLYTVNDEQIVLLREICQSLGFDADDAITAALHQQKDEDFASS